MQEQHSLNILGKDSNNRDWTKISLVLLKSGEMSLPGERHAVGVDRLLRHLGFSCIMEEERVKQELAKVLKVIRFFLKKMKVTFEAEGEPWLKKVKMKR